MVREADRWTLSGGGILRKEKVDELTKALSSLRIVDVQPKPLGLSRDLKTPEGIRLSPEAIISLRQKGFFVTSTGQLLSNEGELIVETTNGLHYTLRFGEIAPGTAVVSSEGGTSSKESAMDPGERRYLFITVNYSLAQAQREAGDGKESGEKGKQLERELRNRFADWYYVISGADFQKLRPQRKDLVKG